MDFMIFDPHKSRLDGPQCGLHSGPFCLPRLHETVSLILGSVIDIKYKEHALVQQKSTVEFFRIEFFEL